jgi:hypothetical protein
VSISKSIPPPVGGLNAREALAEMPISDAVVMDNWFPETSSVKVRKGCVSWATGFPGRVESIMAYRSGTQEQLFGAADDGIYDATSQGAIGAAEVSGFTSARWQHVNMGTAGGQFLLCANGADPMQIYDGSTWAAASITGVTGGTDTIINLNLHKERLWMIQANSMKTYYLAVQSIAGAAQPYDLSAYFRRGGHLIQMATWSTDGASGIGVQDMAVFISSEGEVAVYNGTDPSSGDTWSLVGIFYIGRPIGNRPLCKFGADLLIITAQGVFPLSKALLVDKGSLQDAVSNKIVNLINEDVQAYSANFGWELIVSPIDNMLIVNVPTSSTPSVFKSYQYVMNTITGAWCRFTGWRAVCWELLDDSLYYGSTTSIFKANSGQTDNGADIKADCLQAFSSFGEKAREKYFTMARLALQTDAKLTPGIGLNLDFNIRPINTVSNLTPPDGVSSFWDTSPWDTTYWNQGDVFVLQRNWQTVQGIGYYAALRVQISARNSNIRWAGSDIVFEPGGVL